MQKLLVNSCVIGHTSGVRKRQMPLPPLNEILSTHSSFISSIQWRVNGSGPLLCLNAPIGNSAENFVRRSPLAVLLVPMPLCICKFSGFMLAGPKPTGGTFPMLCIFPSVHSTLREGYIIAVWGALPLLCFQCILTCV